MKFIGRQSELQTLEQEYHREGGFVVIYGRRRVGKTRLIKEFYQGYPSPYRWDPLLKRSASTEGMQV